MLVLYMYLLGTFILWFNESETHGTWKWLDWTDKFVLITWPCIPLWLVGALLYEKYDDWKYEKARKKWEKDNPPIDNDGVTE